MTAFKFPAKPEDGDIIVRDNIQAFYNSSTNTWRLSQMDQIAGIPGPPGPAGPSGPPGSGVDVKGAVDTVNDLPLPNNHQFEFWVVDDSNTLYFSDGQQWIDFGSPIRGPKGDAGNDGTNGTDGTNGQNGRGWYDTSIIDERPNNYQISFLSNDGLTFTTDNIMGPEGDAATIPVASADRLGGIKIGRGLNILPDGTAQAGETKVDLETVPLGPDGDTINNFYTLGLTPQFTSWGDNYSGSQNGSSGSGKPWKESNRWAAQMAADADMAIVYYFSAAAATTYAPAGVVVPSWFSGETKLEVEGATFEDGGKLTVPHDINISTISSQQALSASTPALKIGLIRFEPGAEVTFIASAKVRTSRKMSWTIGRGRIGLQPFKTGASREDVRAVMEAFAESYNDGTDFDGLPDITPEENNRLEASALKTNISGLKQFIDELVVQEFPPSDTGNYNALMAIRQNLIDMRNLPGTADELEAVFQTYQQQVLAIGDYTFRFE